MEVQGVAGWIRADVLEVGAGVLGKCYVAVLTGFYYLLGLPARILGLIVGAFDEVMKGLSVVMSSGVVPFMGAGRLKHAHHSNGTNARPWRRDKSSSQCTH